MEALVSESSIKWNRQIQLNERYDKFKMHVYIRMLVRMYTYRFSVISTTSPNVK